MKAKLWQVLPVTFGIVALFLLGATNITRDYQAYQLGTYAAIYVNDASAAQTIPTGATHTKITLFTQNGVNSNCTADVSNDKVTVTHAGTYHITGALSFKSDTGAVVWHVAPFVNGAEVPAGHFERKTAANDVGAAAIDCIVEIGANEDVDLRVKHDSGGNVDFTLQQGTVSVVYLSE